MSYPQDETYDPYDSQYVSCLDGTASRPITATATPSAQREAARCSSFPFQTPHSGRVRSRTDAPMSMEPGRVGDPRGRLAAAAGKEGGAGEEPDEGMDGGAGGAFSPGGGGYTSYQTAVSTGTGTGTGRMGGGGGGVGDADYKDAGGGGGASRGRGAAPPLGPPTVTALQGMGAGGGGVRQAPPPDQSQRQRQQSGKPAVSSTIQLPQDFFLDEQAEAARHPFPIPPDVLISQARKVLAVGVYKWPDLSEDFEFSAPFIGPLGPEAFRATLSTLKLEEAFPDMAPRYHHFRVDSFRPNRVWFTLRPRCTHTGPFRGKLPFTIKPTGRVIEEPPQTASLTFNPAGEVSGYTMGYVMDRTIGNTGGLGSAFGLMWALGAPLPAPEGHPWSASTQLKAVNSGSWALQAAAYLYDRVSSWLLPSSWITQHRRNTM